MLLAEAGDIAVGHQRVADGLIKRPPFIVGRRDDKATLARLVSVEIIGRNALVSLGGVGNFDDAFLLSEQVNSFEDAPGGNQLDGAPELGVLLAADGGELGDGHIVGSARFEKRVAVKLRGSKSGNGWRREIASRPCHCDRAPPLPNDYIFVHDARQP